jgi:class 3 adenylate cyclase
MAVAIRSQGKVLPEGFLNEPPLRQRLATILVADVAGYSRLMG